MEAQKKMDAQLDAVVSKCGIDGAVPWVLMAGLLYYHCNISLLTDEKFDATCKMLYDNWRTLKHEHRHIVGQEALKSGTLYHLSIENYPRSVRGGAFSIIAGRGFGMNADDRDRIYNERFIPPKECWDVYVYGAEGRTWSQHQTAMINQWQSQVNSGKLGFDDACALAIDIGCLPEQLSRPAARQRKRVIAPAIRKRVRPQVTA